MTTTQTPTAWPENVIARYFTLAGPSVPGATVDLTHEDMSDTAKATRATCNCCQESGQFEWADQYPRHCRPGYVDYQNQRKGDYNARSWAQSHAETCRALPAPSPAEPEPKRRFWLPGQRTA
ncbi:hypothetical protein [Streptomyces sp. NBC_00932]|uniref:hypothetical protein n=1 Tax=Streptomyces sp. NBC_00932 TaxID=2903690 RepID=UPI003865466D|nr:hypothetical protein OG221_27710 [Streptomyces sp. NBC_00932]